MKFLKLSFFFTAIAAAVGCVGNMNPTGGNSAPDYPYFITKTPLVVKKILVPIGTKLVYEEATFKKGEQKSLMDERKLTDIRLPEGKTILWREVPITWISKYFNQEMRGFTVYADFSKLSPDKKNKFTEMWESCSDGLGLTVKDINDWSFNKNNIADVESCSVNYQRYFKDDNHQQQFLNEMFAELNKINVSSNSQN
ncbi:MAG: hypothetical protein EOO42_19445 [Flavobacteriales bacterium]|nr:MAG: hypothetical protein EOO42_19445 [Flavobacteriales bacterium]